MDHWIDEIALDADDAAYLRRGAELVAAGAKPLDQVAQMQMRAYCIARDKWESKHKENEEMNEHELTVYERIADPLAAVKALGSAIARSRIFGCESEAQGEVLAWECMARRVPPLSLKESYHLINTSAGTALTMRSDAMLRGFILSGGRHRIIRRDAEAAEVELTINGQTHKFECTYAEAKNAGYTEGKKGEKDNWSSPRQRMQMLWARVISDGVRAMAPQVCAGRYTPEDFGVTLPHQEPAGTEADGSQARTDTVVETIAVVTSEPAPSVAEESARKEPTGKEPARTDPDEAAPALVPDAVRKQIEGLYEELQVPLETREAALKKRGVNSLRSLTAGQAAEILAKLEVAKAKRSPPVQEMQVAGPATAEQVAQIKSLCGEIKETHPELLSKLAARMKAAGLKFAGLTFEQARALIEQLKLRNLESFFSQSLGVAAEPDLPF